MVKHKQLISIIENFVEQNTVPRQIIRNSNTLEENNYKNIYKTVFDPTMKKYFDIIFGIEFDIKKIYIYLIKNFRTLFDIKRHPNIFLIIIYFIEYKNCDPIDIYLQLVRKKLMYNISSNYEEEYFNVMKMYNYMVQKYNYRYKIYIDKKYGTYINFHKDHLTKFEYFRGCIDFMDRQEKKKRILLTTKDINYLTKINIIHFITQYILKPRTFTELSILTPIYDIELDYCYIYDIVKEMMLTQLVDTYPIFIEHCMIVNNVSIISNWYTNYIYDIGKKYDMNEEIMTILINLARNKEYVTNIYDMGRGIINFPHGKIKYCEKVVKNLADYGFEYVEEGIFKTDCPYGSVIKNVLYSIYTNNIYTEDIISAGIFVHWLKYFPKVYGKSVYIKLVNRINERYKKDQNSWDKTYCRIVKWVHNHLHRQPYRDNLMKIFKEHWETYSYKTTKRGIVENNDNQNLIQKKKAKYICYNKCGAKLYKIDGKKNYECKDGKIFVLDYIIPKEMTDKFPKYSLATCTVIKKIFYEQSFIGIYDKSIPVIEEDEIDCNFFELYKFIKAEHIKKFKIITQISKHSKICTQIKITRYLKNILKRLPHIYACIQSYKFRLTKQLKYHNIVIQLMNYNKKKSILRNVEEYLYEETFDIKTANGTIKAHKYLKYFHGNKIKKVYNIPKEAVKKYLNWLYVGFYDTNLSKFKYPVEFYYCGHKDSEFVKKYTFLVAQSIKPLQYINACIKANEYKLYHLLRCFHYEINDTTDEIKKSLLKNMSTQSNEDTMKIWGQNGSLRVHKYLDKVTNIDNKYNYDIAIVEVYINWLYFKKIFISPKVNIMDVYISGIGDRKFGEACIKKIESYIDKNRSNKDILKTSQTDIIIYLKKIEKNENMENRISELKRLKNELSGKCLLSLFQKKIVN